MNQSNNVQTFLSLLKQMPAGAKLSFRGWAHPPGMPAFTMVTQTVIASSAAIEVGTGGFSTEHLGILIARSGKDLQKLSAMPKAAEVTFAPGILIRAHEPFTLEGMNTRVYEELTVDKSGNLTGMDITEEDLIASVHEAINKGRETPLPVPVEYCSRFLSPLE